MQIQQKQKLIFQLWELLRNDTNVMENLAQFIDENGEETFTELMLSDFEDEVCNYGPPLFAMVNPESDWDNPKIVQIRLNIIEDFLESEEALDQIKFNIKYSDNNYPNQIYYNAGESKLELNFYQFLMNLIYICSDIKSSYNKEYCVKIKSLSQKIIALLEEKGITE